MVSQIALRCHGDHFELQSKRALTLWFPHNEWLGWTLRGLTNGFL